MWRCRIDGRANMPWEKNKEQFYGAGIESTDLNSIKMFATCRTSSFEHLPTWKQLLTFDCFHFLYKFSPSSLFSRICARNNNTCIQETIVSTAIEFDEFVTVRSRESVAQRPPKYNIHTNMMRSNRSSVIYLIGNWLSLSPSLFTIRLVQLPAVSYA